MDFKQKFLTALRAGKDDKDLLGIVRESQTKSFTMREAYDALQEIWIELGFDERSDGGSLQDRLEYVMEKVWYECPVGESLTPNRELGS